MKGGKAADNLRVLLGEASGDAKVDGEGAVDGVNLEGVTLHFTTFFTDDFALMPIKGIGAGQLLRLLGLTARDYLEEKTDIGFIDKVNRPCQDTGKGARLRVLNSATVAPLPGCVHDVHSCRDFGRAGTRGIIGCRFFLAGGERDDGKCHHCQ